MSESLCLASQEPWLCTYGKPNDAVMFIIITIDYAHGTQPSTPVPLGSGPIWRFQACSLLPTVLSSDYRHCRPLNKLWTHIHGPVPLLTPCLLGLDHDPLLSPAPPPPPQMSAVINQPRFHSQFNCFCPWTPVYCVHIYISLSGHFVLR